MQVLAKFIEYFENSKEKEMTEQMKVKLIELNKKASAFQVTTQEDLNDLNLSLSHFKKMLLNALNLR